MFGPHRPLHLKAGPGGGLLYWQPRAGVFPSGLSGWLDLPLSLYAPAYSLESVYINESAALPRYLKQFMVPLATDNLLENSEPHQCSLGVAACPLLCTLMAALLMRSSHSEGTAGRKTGSRVMRCQQAVPFTTTCFATAQRLGCACSSKTFCARSTPTLR